MKITDFTFEMTGSAAATITFDAATTNPTAMLFAFWFDQNYGTGEFGTSDVSYHEEDGTSEVVIITKGILDAEAKVGDVVWDVNNNVARWNKGFRSMFRYTGSKYSGEEYRAARFDACIAEFFPTFVCMDLNPTHWNNAGRFTCLNRRFLQSYEELTTVNGMSDEDAACEAALEAANVCGLEDAYALLVKHLPAKTQELLAPVRARIEATIEEVLFTEVAEA